jgi:hypothetical protein
MRIEHHSLETKCKNMLMDSTQTDGSKLDCDGQGNPSLASQSSCTSGNGADLEREAEGVAQITLQKNKENVNFFINILPGALAMANK